MANPNFVLKKLDKQNKIIYTKKKEKRFSFGGIMQTRVSVKDIAKELNISLSTVHKALTGKNGIGEARRKEVLETAHRLGYEVNSVAQSLARKDIRLGIFMPNRWQEYFEAMKEGMEEEIRKLKKYKVEGLFYYLSKDLSDKEAEKALSWIREENIDVLIYCPSIYALNQAFLDALKNAKVPVFLAGSSFQAIERIAEIHVDAPLSGKIAADFLRHTAKSPLTAAVLAGYMSVRPHKEKAEAFCERIRSFGGTATVFETEDDADKTYAMAKKAAEEGYNAIYVATATSESACRYIEEEGLQNEISLICTDVFDLLKGYMKRNVVKATIYQNQEKVGRSAVRAAYDYLVKTHSYGMEEETFADTISIRPTLLMLADIE